MQAIHIVTLDHYSDDWPLPQKQTPHAAAVDLRAAIKKERAYFKKGKIPTGIKVAIPKGYHGRITLRSGFAYDESAWVPNGVGVIDADYRGEIYVPLLIGSEFQRIQPGQRIAQMTIHKNHPFEFVEVDTLDDTQRGNGGFGSTGDQ